MSDTPNKEDEELFQDNFYSWLEKHGAQLAGKDVAGFYKVYLNLNGLKSAILQRDASRDQQIALAARKDEITKAKVYDEENNYNDSGFTYYIHKREAELAALKQETQL